MPVITSDRDRPVLAMQRAAEIEVAFQSLAGSLGHILPAPADGPRRAIRRSLPAYREARSCPSGCRRPPTTRPGCGSRLAAGLSEQQHDLHVRHEDLAGNALAPHARWERGLRYSEVRGRYRDRPRSAARDSWNAQVSRAAITTAGGSCANHDVVVFHRAIPKGKTMPRDARRRRPRNRTLSRCTG